MRFIAAIKKLLLFFNYTVCMPQTEAWCSRRKTQPIQWQGDKGMRSSIRTLICKVNWIQQRKIEFRKAIVKKTGQQNSLVNQFYISYMYGFLSYWILSLSIDRTFWLNFIHRVSALSCSISLTLCITALFAITLLLFHLQW